MAAENFAEPTFRAVAAYRYPDGGAGGDHAHPTVFRINDNGIGGGSGPALPPNRKDATLDSLAGLANHANIARAAEMLRGEKSHVKRGLKGGNGKG
jgi:hypothetical protein